MNTTPRARRLLVRFLTAAGVAGLTAVAAAQQPTLRVATLLPPQPLDPGERAPVARGAMDDGQPNAKRGATGPAWLTGAPDPNVRPAGGAVPKMTGTYAPTPDKAPGEPSFLARGLDKVKSAVGIEKQPQQQQAKPTQREVPTAATPFQGMAANGAPVFAGPPAYRWFGYGTVTPGTNALAPTGLYPKASAEWHRLTGATPGAVPVPVSNTGIQQASGSEPPVYQPPVVRTQAPTGGPVVARPPEPTRIAASPVRTEPIRTDEPRFIPPPPVDTHKLVPQTAPSNVPPVGVPTLSPPPLAAPAPAVTVPEVRVPTLSAIPVQRPPAPEVLPASLTTDETKWQKTNQPEPWSPVGGRPVTGDPAWQPGAADAPPTVRGQAPQTQQADPIVTLIKTLCKDRATDVDVRYVGTKKLSVCFEVRGAAAANKLVKDIGNRKELVPYQIDFCVLVK